MSNYNIWLIDCPVSLFLKSVAEIHILTGTLRFIEPTYRIKHRSKYTHTRRRHWPIHAMSVLVIAEISEIGAARKEGTGLTANTCTHSTDSRLLEGTYVPLDPIFRYRAIIVQKEQHIPGCACRAEIA